jgi:transposase-like protein
MVGHGAKFGRKKEEAIAALLVQRNVEEAARSIGIATQTLVRWMKVPEFQTAYREARRAAFSQATARLQQAMSAVVTTLLKLAVDPNAPAAVKARAAYYILTLATKAMETDDIDARVLALERAAELTNQGSMNLTPQPESQW